MAGIKELLKAEENGALSFGDYTLASKTKLEDFKHEGDIYKVKTFNEITRLERNDAFLYESSPGTTVRGLKYEEGGVSFSVEGASDAQLTLDLNEDSEYEISVGQESRGVMKTGMSGKLSFGVELEAGVPVDVKIRLA